MARLLFFVCLLLPLCLAQIPSTGLDRNPDPSCSRGLRAGSACCPSACGQCGGTGCNKRGLSAQCCSGAVSKSGRGCSSVGPPCKVGASGGNTGGKNTGGGNTGSGSTGSGNRGVGGGKGKWKNIDSSISGRPRSRHEACFVMANGKGYLLGGRGDNGLDIFNPKTRRWSRGNGMPTQMHHMQCVVWRGSIYIAASWFGPSPRESINPLMWIYDTKKDSWSSRPGLPPQRRRGAAASVMYNNKIWVVGGNIGGHGPPSRTLGWMDYYDLITKKWRTNLPSLPEGRDHVGGAIVKGMLCIAGGRDGGADSFFGATILSTYCYNFRTKKWKNMKAPIPVGRAGAATARTCDGKMMIAGGEGKFSPAFSRIDIFNGVRWESGPSLVRARHGTGLAVAQCGCRQIFIASGSGMRGGRPELDSTEVLLPGGKDVRCDRY